MWGVRAIPLPVGPVVRPWLPTLTALVATFWGLYSVVNPLVVKGSKALAALKANDHQIDGPAPLILLDEFGLSPDN